MPAVRRPGPEPLGADLLDSAAVSKAAKRERQKENRERARIERERMQKRQRQLKTARGLLYLLAPLVVIAIIVSLTSSSDTPTRDYKTAPKVTIDPNKTYTATIDTTEGNIVVALDPEAAPNAVNSFVFLAKNRFYDGLCIDRIMPGFGIQGGSPKCDRGGGPGYTVTDKPSSDFAVGSFVAARSADQPPGAFGSQFYIVSGDVGSVPKDDLRFGSVQSGLDVVQKIQAKTTKPPGSDMPESFVRIDKVTIATGSTPPTSSTTTTTATP